MLLITFSVGNEATLGKRSDSKPKDFVK